MQLNQIIEILNLYQPNTLPETEISAAVLVLIACDESGDVFLMITKRSQQVAKYAGDYCFPGGIKESGDINFKETAKREVAEELGMTADSFKIIGQLDDFFDRYHHLVRPYVAVLNEKNVLNKVYQFNSEIEKIYFFPLHELQHIQEDQKLEAVLKRHPAYLYQQGDVVVWGLTATIMVHLENILFMKNRGVGKGPR